MIKYKKIANPGELVCGLRGSHQLRPFKPDLGNANVGNKVSHSIAYY